MAVHPSPVRQLTTPFENLRREVDRLFDDFHQFSRRLLSISVKAA